MWLTRLYARFRDLVHEFGKFGIVGTVAYAVDTALLALFLLTMEPLTAKALATAVAATVAFVGNRFWTWRYRARSGLAREYLLYFILNGVGLAIALAILSISHYGLGAVWPAFQTRLADIVAANVVGLVAGTFFRFWSYRRFVFKLPDPDPAEAAAAGPAAAAEPAAAEEPTEAAGAAEPTRPPAGPADPSLAPAVRASGRGVA